MYSTSLPRFLDERDGVSAPTYPRISSPSSQPTVPPSASNLDSLSRKLAEIEALSAIKAPIMKSAKAMTSSIAGKSIPVSTFDPDTEEMKPLADGEDDYDEDYDAAETVACKAVDLQKPAREVELTENNLKDLKGSTSEASSSSRSLTRATSFSVTKSSASAKKPQKPLQRTLSNMPESAAKTASGGEGQGNFSSFEAKLAELEAMMKAGGPIVASSKTPTAAAAAGNTGVISSPRTKVEKVSVPVPVLAPVERLSSPQPKVEPARKESSPQESMNDDSGEQKKSDSVAPVLETDSSPAIPIVIQTALKGEEVLQVQDVELTREEVGVSDKESVEEQVHRHTESNISDLEVAPALLSSPSVVVEEIAPEIIKADGGGVTIVNDQAVQEGHEPVVFADGNPLVIHGTATIIRQVGTNMYVDESNRDESNQPIEVAEPESSDAASTKEISGQQTETVQFVSEESYAQEISHSSITPTVVPASDVVSSPASVIPSSTLKSPMKEVESKTAIPTSERPSNSTSVATAAVEGDTILNRPPPVESAPVSVKDIAAFFGRAHSSPQVNSRAGRIQSPSILQAVSASSSVSGRSFSPTQPPAQLANTAMIETTLKEPVEWEVSNLALPLPTATLNESEVTSENSKVPEYMQARYLAEPLPERNHPQVTEQPISIDTTFVRRISSPSTKEDNNEAASSSSLLPQPPLNHSQSPPSILSPKAASMPTAASPVPSQKVANERTPKRSHSSNKLKNAPSFPLQAGPVIDLAERQLTSVIWSEHVQSDALSRVIELSLRTNCLTELAPLQLTPQLPALRICDLSFNVLRGKVAAGDLPLGLVRLDLSHNKLSDIHGVMTCVNLTELNVSYNRIRNLFGVPTKLEVLDISHNDITAINSVRSLSISTVLSNLHIAGNPVMESIAHPRLYLTAFLRHLVYLDGNIIATQKKFKQPPPPTHPISSIGHHPGHTGFASHPAPHRSPPQKPARSASASTHLSRYSQMQKVEKLHNEKKKIPAPEDFDPVDVRDTRKKVKKVEPIELEKIVDRLSVPRHTVAPFRKEDDPVPVEKVVRVVNRKKASDNEENFESDLGASTFVARGGASEEKGSDATEKTQAAVSSTTPTVSPSRVRAVSKTTSNNQKAKPPQQPLDAQVGFWLNKKRQQVYEIAHCFTLPFSLGRGGLSEEISRDDINLLEEDVELARSFLNLPLIIRRAMKASVLDPNIRQEVQEVMAKLEKAVALLQQIQTVALLALDAGVQYTRALDTIMRSPSGVYVNEHVLRPHHCAYDEVVDEAPAEVAEQSSVRKRSISTDKTGQQGQRTNPKNHRDSPSILPAPPQPVDSSSSEFTHKIRDYPRTEAEKDQAARDNNAALENMRLRIARRFLPPSLLQTPAVASPSPSNYLYKGPESLDSTTSAAISDPVEAIKVLSTVDRSQPTKAGTGNIPTVLSVATDQNAETRSSTVVAEDRPVIGPAVEEVERRTVAATRTVVPAIPSLYSPMEEKLVTPVESAPASTAKTIEQSPVTLNSVPDVATTQVPTCEQIAPPLIMTRNRAESYSSVDAEIATSLASINRLPPPPSQTTKMTPLSTYIVPEYRQAASFPHTDDLKEATQGSRDDYARPPVERIASAVPTTLPTNSTVRHEAPEIATKPFPDLKDTLTTSHTVEARGVDASLAIAIPPLASRAEISLPNSDKAMSSPSVTTSSSSQIPPPLNTTLAQSNTSNISINSASSSSTVPTPISVSNIDMSQMSNAERFRLRMQMKREKSGASTPVTSSTPPVQVTSAPIGAASVTETSVALSGHISSGTSNVGSTSAGDEVRNTYSLTQPTVRSESSTSNTGTAVPTAVLKRDVAPPAVLSVRSPADVDNSSPLNLSSAMPPPTAAPPSSAAPFQAPDTVSAGVPERLESDIQSRSDTPVDASTQASTNVSGSSTPNISGALSARDRLRARMQKNKEEKATSA